MVKKKTNFWNSDKFTKITFIVAVVAVIISVVAIGMQFIGNEAIAGEAFSMRICPYMYCDYIVLVSNGETHVLNEYEITYTYQEYAGGIKDININGESLFDPSVGNDPEYTLTDGTIVSVLQNIYQSYAGGRKEVTICLHD